jgi:sugar PTS system EIIA component
MTTVTSPMAGRIVGLAAVPDPVFSGAMVGPGTAVDPGHEPTVAVAPVDGIVVSLHPHAFVVVEAEGRGVLVHLGIDTVQLNGTGFDVVAAKGDTVKRGDPLVRWHPGRVKEAGKSPLSPVIALEAHGNSLADLAEEGEIAAGGTLFSWT